MPAAGGEAERITWNGGYLARESLDGKWLYYSKYVNPTSFWRISLPARGPGQQETVVGPRIPFPAAATKGWEYVAFYYPAVDDPQVRFPRASHRCRNRTDPGSSGGKDTAWRGLSSVDGHWMLRSQKDRALTLVMVAE
jgi:hypothetical protein